MKKLLVTGAAGLLILVFATSASATPITIDNPSFEVPALADGGAAGNTDWSMFGTRHWAGTFDPTSTHFTGAGGTGTPTGADGENIFIVSTATTSEDPTGTYQDVTTLVAGIYTLTAAVGDMLDPTPVNFLLDISWADEGPGIVSNWTPWARYSGLATELTNGEFVEKSVQLVVEPGDPNIGKTIRIAVAAYNTETEKKTVCFDNVRLDYVVPEPATMGLLLLGGGLVGIRRRRRQ